MRDEPKSDMNPLYLSIVNELSISQIDKMIIHCLNRKKELGKVSQSDLERYQSEVNSVCAILGFKNGIKIASKNIFFMACIVNRLSDYGLNIAQIGIILSKDRSTVDSYFRVYRNQTSSIDLSIYFKEKRKKFDDAYRVFMNTENKVERLLVV